MVMQIKSNKCRFILFETVCDGNNGVPHSQPKLRIFHQLHNVLKGSTTKQYIAKSGIDIASETCPRYSYLLCLTNSHMQHSSTYVHMSISYCVCTFTLNL